MSERFTPPIQALPDGDAEVRLVLHLPWDVVSALGQEAGRLAAQMHRPVSLDEAISHRLRTQAMSTAHAKPQLERNQPAPTPSPSAQPTTRSPGEQARHAIDKINGSAPSANGTTHGATHGATGQGGAHSGTEAAGPPPGATAADTPPSDRGILERPARATGPVNGTAHGPGSLNGTATELPR
jgi:hypothetical protein